MTDKIKIRLRNKKGVYQIFTISKDNLWKYIKTKYGYSKKSVERIKKIKEKIREKRYVERYKEKIRKYKEYRKKYLARRKEERERRKRIKRCNFNYNTRNHKGYLFNKKTEIYVSEDTTEIEHKENISEIVDTVLKFYYNTICPQRIHYVTLEYVILKEGSENVYSAVTSHYNLSLEGLIKEISEERISKKGNVYKGLYYQIVENVVYGASPNAVLIYNIKYVNYELKHML